MIAQAMRAILLATTTATSLASFLASSLMFQECLITLVRDDRAKLRETFASRLRNQAELGKVGAERIDQLRALTD